MLHGKQFDTTLPSTRSRRLLTVIASLTVAILATTAARPAFAIKQFFDEFKELYVNAEGGDAEKALAEAVETAKCNVCHFGKSKKNRNAYGEALDEFLDKKDDKDNKEKIREVLEKVAAMEGPDGKTFGDRMKAGMLPADAPEGE
jgi:CRISPR/Cas system CSM-associated protein Csm2 small subunit